MQNSEVDESTEQSSDGKDGPQETLLLMEQEWPFDQKVDLFELANAAGLLAGRGDKRPAALEDFLSKLRRLERAWHDAEVRYNALKSANERLTNQLVHSRAKCAIYQKKLRFIQDNQKNFAKLKEVYMTMKCEEGGVKSFVDLKDRASQTVPLVVTLNPLVTTGESLTGCLVPIKQDSLVSLRKSDIGEAQQNLKILKHMIANREHSWVLGKKIEEGLRSELKALQTQKITLEEIITIKDNEIETLKSIQLKPSIREELFDDLKRIITKMDRRMRYSLKTFNHNNYSLFFHANERDLERAGKIGRYIVIFSDKERVLIQDILDKQPIEVINRTVEISKQETKSKEMPKRHSISSKSGPISIPKKIHQSSSSIGDRKQLHNVPPREHLKKPRFDEAGELETLQKIKKEIEQKQSALREKVQQIIDYSAGKEASITNAM